MKRFKDVEITFLSTVLRRYEIESAVEIHIGRI